jgi:hypothetical protein
VTRDKPAERLEDETTLKQASQKSINSERDNAKSGVMGGEGPVFRTVRLMEVLRSDFKQSRGRRLRWTAKMSRHA